MSAARRSLLTATAAGTLLCALWFVPSAPATAHTATVASATDTVPGSGAPTPDDSQITGARPLTAHSEASAGDAQLADTGSVDTAPYVLGGTLFLGLGAGFVLYSVRRGRAEAF